MTEDKKVKEQKTKKRSIGFSKIWSLFQKIGSAVTTILFILATVLLITIEVNILSRSASKDNSNTNTKTNIENHITLDNNYNK